jgi:hypothetical protein
MAQNFRIQFFPSMTNKMEFNMPPMNGINYSLINV